MVAGFEVSTEDSYESVKRYVRQLAEAACGWVRCTVCREKRPKRILPGAGEVS